MQSYRQYINLIKENRAAGLSVSIVSICLSIPLAIASGATPLQGLLAAIWGGAFAALFGGSNYNIIGPAGALSGLLLVATTQLGTQRYTTLTILIGLFTLLFRVTRVSKYITLIPSTALHGFMMGVGLIIGFSQLNNALGLFGLQKHESMIQNIVETFSHFSEISLITVGIFIGAFVLLKLRTRFFKSIPAVLPVTILGVIFGIIGKQLGLDFLTLNDQFPALTFSLMDGQPRQQLIQLFTTGSEGLNTLLKISSAALPIAVVAILETIISAKVADKQTKTKHHQSHEVRGLGLANLASGIFGGMPVTGVFVRTAMNIRSGANSWMSALINTIFVVIISWLLFGQFVNLPLAVIAAILINLALGMIDISLYKKLRSFDSKSFRLVMIVGMVTRLEDPIYGIILGTVAALLMYIRDVTKGDMMVNVFRNGEFHKRWTIMKYISKQEDYDIAIIKLPHDMTFLNASQEIEHIEAISKPSIYIFSCSQLQYMDIDALEGLEDILISLQQCGKQRYISGMGGPIESMMLKLYIVQQHADRIFDGTSDVLAFLKHTGGL